MVPLLVRQADIKDGIPIDKEVTEAVRGLREADRGDRWACT